MDSSYIAILGLITTFLSGIIAAIINVISNNRLKKLEKEHNIFYSVFSKRVELYEEISSYLTDMTDFFLAKRTRLKYFIFFTNVSIKLRHFICLSELYDSFSLAKLLEDFKEHIDENKKIFDVDKLDLKNCIETIFSNYPEQIMKEISLENLTHTPTITNDKKKNKRATAFL
jgi:hypothetical protein